MAVVLERARVSSRSLEDGVVQNLISPGVSLGHAGVPEVEVHALHIFLDFNELLGPILQKEIEELDEVRRETGILDAD